MGACMAFPPLLRASAYRVPGLSDEGGFLS